MTKYSGGGAGLEAEPEPEPEVSFIIQICYYGDVTDTTGGHQPPKIIVIIYQLFSLFQKLIINLLISCWRKVQGANEGCNMQMSCLRPVTLTLI